MANPVPPLLRSVHAKLTRAQEHLDFLNSEIERYFTDEMEPIPGEVDPRPDGGALHLHLSGVAHTETYIRWSVIIGDCAHNIRSALDHLTWQLVQVTGGKATEYTQFPILRCPPTAAADGEVKPPSVAGLTDQRALACIAAVQPYNDPLGRLPEDQELWLLNRLSRYDKHRTINFAVPHLLGSAAVAGSELGRKRIRGTFRLTRVENCVATMEFVPDEPVDMKAEVAVRVAFTEEGDPIDKRTAPEALARLIHFVTDNVVAPIQAAYFREH